MKRVAILLCLSAFTAIAQPPPQAWKLSARASEIDPNAREHPEIDFVFEKKGKPADLQHGWVDTRAKAEGKLVIWLMAHNGGLFERLNSYGLHAIQVHYANGWFGKLSPLAPAGDTTYLGRIRLEAATGEDVSTAVTIPKADSIRARALQFVKWLAKENPPGQWQQFLTADATDLRWEKVILSGSSHGSTTAARFAKHQAVDRVVMLCGPRDQFETWQSLPTATPTNRFFGFSHVLDGGWSGDHYCRSWELLGLHEYGPITNVEEVKPPYGNTRRLVSSADVKNDADKAHSAVTPGKNSPADSTGKLLYEDVWRYLYTHPVEQVGAATERDADCEVAPPASSR
jgi:hypothetical protein